MKRNTTYNNLLHTTKGILRGKCTYEHQHEKKSGRSKISNIVGDKKLIKSRVSQTPN
jgi:hypothetical protein